MSEVCDFIGIDFLPSMINMSKPSENLGDTTGNTHIVVSNQHKYASQLPEHTIKRIEEIVYPLALELHYAPEFATDFRPLLPTRVLLLKVQDGIAWTMFHFGEKGIRRGLEYLYHS